MILDIDAHFIKAEIAGTDERESIANRIANDLNLERIDGNPQWEPERDEETFKAELADIVRKKLTSAKLSAEQCTMFVNMVCSYSKFFTMNKEKLGCYLYGECDIPTTTNEPIFRPRHRLSASEWAIIDDTANILMRSGVCSDSISPYGSPSVVPPKKDADGEWNERRVCVDQRAINEKTIRDRYPMKLPEDIFADLA